MMAEYKVGQTISAEEFQALQKAAPAQAPTVTTPQPAAPDDGLLRSNIPVGTTISAAEFEKLSQASVQGPSAPIKPEDSTPWYSKLAGWTQKPLVTGLSERYPSKPETEYLEVQWLGDKVMAKAPYQIKQWAWGVGKGVVDMLESFTSPMNIGIAAGTMGASLAEQAVAKGATNMALRIAGKSTPYVTGLFTAEMIHAVPEQVKEAAEAIKSGDQARASEAITNLAISSALIGAAGTHTVKGIGEQIKGAKAKPKAVADAQSAVDDLAGTFDTLKSLGDEELAKQEPSALAEAEKYDRAMAIERQLQKQERLRQSPQGAALLKEELAAQDAISKEVLPSEPGRRDVGIVEPGKAESLKQRMDDALQKAEAPKKAYQDISKAIEESYKALKEAMGGGRLGLQAFSEENYRQAKPHMDAAWESYKAAGKSFEEFSQKFKEAVGDVAVPYLSKYQTEVMAPVMPQQKQQEEQVAQAAQTTPPEQVQAKPTKDLADIDADQSLPYKPSEVAEAVYALRDKQPNQFELKSKAQHVDDYLKGKELSPERAAEIRKAIDWINEVDTDRVKVPEDKLPEMDPNTVVVQRKSSDGLPAPPVLKWQYDNLKTIQEIPKTTLNYGFDKPIFFMERLAGKAGDTIKDIFYRPYNEADYNAKRYVKDKVDGRKEAMKLYKAKESSGERIGTYLIAQDPVGAKTLEKHGISVPKLTQSELAMANWMRAEFDKTHPEINAARKFSGLNPIGYTENYLPFMRIFEKAARENGNQVLEDAGFMAKYFKEQFNEMFPQERFPEKGGYSQYVKPRSTPFRFGKERVESTRKLKMNAFNIFDNYMRVAGDHIYKGPAIAQMREYTKVFKKTNGRETAFSLKEQAPNTYDAIDRYLKFIAGIDDVRLIGPTISRGLGRLQNNLSAAMLSANIRSAAIQPTALLNSAVVIGKKYTALGIADMMNEVAGRTVGNVTKTQTNLPHNNILKESRSLFMREFTDAVDIAFRAAQKEGGPIRKGANTVESAIRKLTRLGFSPLSWLDYGTASASFYGAFRYATKELGMSRERARLYADEHVVKTQGSAARQNLAPVQRHALGRALTMFQNFVINDWNFMRWEVAGKNNPRITDSEAFLRIIKLMTGMSAIGVMYEKILPEVPGVGPLIAGGSPLPSPITAVYDEVRKGEGGVKAVTKAAKEMLEVMPGPFSSLRYGTSPFGVVGQFGQDVAEVAAGKAGPKPYVPELVGQALGIPGTRQASKIARAKVRQKREEQSARVPEIVRQLRKERAKMRNEMQNQ
jgi:hypothetical protein